MVKKDFFFQCKHFNCDNSTAMRTARLGNNSIVLQFNYEAAWLWNSTAVHQPWYKVALGQGHLLWLEALFCLPHSTPFRSTVPCSACSSMLKTSKMSQPQTESLVFGGNGKCTLLRQRRADLYQGKSPPLVSDWSFLMQMSTLNSCGLIGPRKHCPDWLE